MSTTTHFKVCPTCQTPAPPNAIRCSTCGHLFSSAYSTQVGQTPYPRAQAPAPGAASTDPNRWLIAMLLAFFIGPFGVHRFYMGYTTIGVVMLTFELIGLATACIAVGFVILAVIHIWAFVEFVLICCNSIPMADGTPLR